jgi:hypothetical protein
MLLSRIFPLPVEMGYFNPSRIFCKSSIELPVFSCLARIDQSSLFSFSWATSFRASSIERSDRSRSIFAKKKNAGGTRKHVPEWKGKNPISTGCIHQVVSTSKVETT